METTFTTSLWLSEDERWGEQKVLLFSPPPLAPSSVPSLLVLHARGTLHHLCHQLHPADRTDAGCDLRRRHLASWQVRAWAGEEEVPFRTRRACDHKTSWAEAGRKVRRDRRLLSSPQLSHLSREGIPDQVTSAFPMAPKLVWMGLRSLDCWSVSLSLPSPKGPWAPHLRREWVSQSPPPPRVSETHSVMSDSATLWTLCVYHCHVRLFATPWTVARQAPLSMGSSRQQYWGGLPFPPPPLQWRPSNSGSGERFTGTHSSYQLWPALVCLLSFTTAPGLKKGLERKVIMYPSAEHHVQPDWGGWGCCQNPGAFPWCCSCRWLILNRTPPWVGKVSGADWSGLSNNRQSLIPNIACTWICQNPSALGHSRWQLWGSPAVSAQHEHLVVSQPPLTKIAIHHCN